MLSKSDLGLFVQVERIKSMFFPGVETMPASQQSGRAMTAMICGHGCSAPSFRATGSLQAASPRRRVVTESVTCTAHTPDLEMRNARVLIEVYDI